VAGPSRSLVRAALAAASLATLVACSGGGGHNTLTPATSQPSQPGGAPASTATQSGFVYDATTLAKSTLLHPASFGTYSFDAALTMRDAAGLRTYAMQVSNPASGNYRHFLTPDQIADRYSASASDSAKAIAYFKSFGLQVSSWRQRLLLRVVGSQSALEAAFHTKFGVYQTPAGEQYIGPMTPPSVSAGIPVAGSPNIVRRPRRYDVSLVHASTSTGNETGYAPAQTATAFDYASAYAAGYTGAGITIGIVGTGPVQTSTGGRMGDAETYKQLYGVGGTSSVSIVSSSSSDPVVNSSSGFSSPPPVTAPCDTGSPTSPTSNCNPEDGEAQIDTEQAASLAKDSSIQFYLAYNPNDDCPNEVIGSPCPAGSGMPEQGLAESDEELQTVIDHDTADVVSMSFGGAEAAQVGSPSPPNEFTADGSGLDPTEFAMMTAEGMAVFASSGDAGANDCQDFDLTGLVDTLCVSYPSTDPNVTAVGGVTLPINGAGQQVGPITAWGLQTSMGASGTGGGVSEYFTQPSYQAGLPGIIGTTRNVPDVALDGDPQTGVSLLLYADPSFGGAEIFPIGGTSVAAPQMAAMWALVLQACKATASCSAKGSGPYPYRLGSPNPELYKLYSNAKTYASTFLPIVFGNNALAQFCYYNTGDPNGICPTPAPGATATPQPSPIPIDPGYSANPGGGYNQLTGIGVPFGRALIKSVVGV
jgi:kumamolisin